MKLYIYDHCPFMRARPHDIWIAVWIFDLRRSTKGIAIITIISFIIFLFFTFFSIIIASIMTIFVAVTPVFLPLESAIEDNHER